ncbi:MAG: hypothetical protein IKG62_05930 [Lachnospiraceae bacterium]|jgi:hypothetical protein|nr:hypothetical protein [Lachnospiraceae bacterium]
MGDVYEELLVKRNATAWQKFQKPLIYGLTGLFVIAGILISPLLLMVGIALLFVCYFYVPRLDLEYEYSYANGEMDIDAVFSKQSRKHKDSLSLIDIECIAPLGSHHLDAFQHGYTVLDYSANDPARKPYVFVRPNDRKLIYLQLEDDDMKRDIKMRKMRQFFED